MNQDELISVIEKLRERPSDPDNWAGLHRLVWPFLMAKMYRGLGGNRYLSEEASQEVLVRIVRAFDFSDSDVTVAKFLKYLVATCNSVLIDLRRTERRQPNVSQEDSSVRFEESPDLRDPSPEERALLRDALERLTKEFTPRERQITYLLMEGKQAGEIAKVTGVAHKTVDNVISVIRQRFRSAFFERDAGVLRS